MSEGEEKSMIERERDAVLAKMAQYQPPPKSTVIQIEGFLGGNLLRFDEITWMDGVAGTDRILRKARKIQVASSVTETLRLVESWLLENQPE